MPSFARSLRSSPSTALLTLGLLFFSAPLTQAQTLLNYYSFDPGTVFTASGFITGATGTGAALSPIGTNPTVDASGRFGAASSFAGANGLDTSTFGNGATTLGNSFSVSVWLKTSDVTALANSYLFQTGVVGGGAQNAVLFGYVSGKTELYGSSQGLSGSTDPRSVSGITLSSALNNTWFNVVYTYDGTTLTGYLNGAQVFSTARDFSFTAAGGLSVGGARDGNGAFPGSLDDFGLWSGVLSAAQVTSLQSTPALGISAIPEPSTYAAIIGGVALGLAAWRRRARTNETGTMV